MKSIPETIISKIEEATKNILGELPKGISVASPSLPGASAALIALALRRLHPEDDLLIITPSAHECEALYSDIHAFDPDPSREPLVLLPPETGDNKTADYDGMRLAAAKALFGSNGDTQLGQLFITTPTALLAPLPDPDAVTAAGLLVKIGESPLPFSDYAEKLAASGYQRRPEVTEKSTFAVRGGLIDIWPPTSPLPVRIDFFGDDVDTIREFDPLTQRSQDRISQVWLPPSSSEILPTVKPTEKLRQQTQIIYLEHDLVSQSARYPNDEIPTPEAFEELLSKLNAIKPSLQLFTGDPAPPSTPTVNLNPTYPPSLADIGGLSNDPTLRSDMRQKLFNELEEKASDGETVVICIDTAGGIEWLQHECLEGSKIALHQAVLSGGFSWKEINLTVLAQPDINATRKRTGRHFTPTSIATKGERVQRPDDLRPGDLVVHIEHGIGRFMGVKKIVRDGKEHEVLSVIYAEGVTLHIPVSQTHLLSRYIGVAGKNATLHKLGGKRWKTECVKAERAVVDYASQLLDLQAKRSSIPGTAFDVNPPWMEAFEASFPYKETKDQVSCIEAVKKDMASERPMDRLICGDAGYGKTEIAMRAAFIAVMNGKQVAVLAPTTVLAEQHFTTFKERMGDYPIRIEVVNRLRPPSVREKILSQTAKGSVDILIGTHAIVQPHIGFKELGLVIIDEEQRFGVEHKERLKRVRETVDLLTLSATPIPRTLYMSMTGARDMSLLQTPPQERLEINTKVERDNDTVIRTAVMREINRQGQIFFLHNRVLTINVMYNRLKRLLPEVRIAVAHGQMKPKELSETMKQFESGQYDMLLSTSIIESGLDIPRANTIIIHRADRFGLAELYQLRGRVGRSSRRGYALLLLPEQGIIDGDARERIKAIQRHGGLSGGLNLALRDLEIRGAGNMLGAEQSGHIAAIGFGLYCQLLKRTVARLKGEKPPKMVDVDLLLDFIEIGPNPDSDNDAAAYIPQDYIDEETLRMNIHRRIAEASEISEIRNLGVELDERFGKMPAVTKRLLRLAELRITASNKGFAKIEVKDGVIRPYNHSGVPKPGPDGKFPRLKGKTIDNQIASIFRALNY